MKFRLMLFAFVLILVSLSAVHSAETSISFSEVLNLSDSSESVWEYSSFVSSSAILEIRTDRKATCRYGSSKGGSYSSLEGEFDYNFETLHKEVFTDLIDGVYRYYIKCVDMDGNESQWLEVSFSASVPVSAQISLSEDSPIRSNKVEVALVTSKVVSQTPTLQYSFDGVSYTPLPLEGTGKNWKGILIIPKSIEESSGSFKFSARDLEGIIGDDITSGDVFVVDRKEPDVVSEINAIGYSGRIKINWEYDKDSDEIDEFRIYRFDSTGVGFTDFYDSTDDSDYVDTNVDKGKRYYYRVSAVDLAGNEGRLSPEVSAIALLSNSSSSSSNEGLSIELLGEVDAFISDLDSVVEEIEDVKSNFNTKDERIKELYSDFGFEREINGVISELTSIKKEAERIKSQKLTSVELDNKISSFEVRLNAAKKRVPENLFISSESVIKGIYSEEEIYKLLLEVDGSQSLDFNEAKAKLSYELGGGFDFSYDTELLNLDLSYLDGSQKEKSIIVHNIDGTQIYNESLSFYIKVPQEIASGLSEIEIYNNGYSIISEGGVFSVDSNTEVVSYGLNRHLDSDSINKARVLLISNYEFKESEGGITGYFSFVDIVDYSSKSFGIGLGALIILGMAFYLFYLKKSDLSSRVILIKTQVVAANRLIENGERDKARALYHKIAEDYSQLSNGEKIQIYGLIDKLYRKI